MSARAHARLSEGVVAIICCCLRALVLSLSVFDIKTMGQWAGRGRRAVCRSSVVYILLWFEHFFKRFLQGFIFYSKTSFLVSSFHSLVLFNLTKTSTYWCLVVVFSVVIIWFYLFFMSVLEWFNDCSQNWHNWSVKRNPFFVSPRVYFFTFPI